VWKPWKAWRSRIRRGVSKPLPSATVWITYSWEDNRDDVDFVAQELGNAGLDVRLDRWVIGAGRRLWEQIESFIQNPNESDGWLLYATQASLGSEACKEEYAYALDRALRTRDSSFPVIALFPSHVEESLIPAGIRTRLYVRLSDPDWRERVVAALERRELAIGRSKIEPYALTVHDRGYERETQRYLIEVRPRAGVWAPFCIAIPTSEKESVNPGLVRGAAGKSPIGGVMMLADWEWTGEAMWVYRSVEEATPTQSYFVVCDELPTRLAFGACEGPTLYVVECREGLCAKVTPSN